MFTKQLKFYEAKIFHYKAERLISKSKRLISKSSSLCSKLKKYKYPNYLKVERKIKNLNSKIKYIQHQAEVYIKAESMIIKELYGTR